MDQYSGDVRDTAPGQPVTYTIHLEQLNTESGGGGKRKFFLPKVPLKFLGVFLGFGAVIVLAFVGVRFFLEKKDTSKVPIVLNYWGFEEDEEGILSVASEYTKQTGVSIEFVKQSRQDYRERLQNFLAKGTGPDIFTFHNSWVLMFDGMLSSLPTDVMAIQDYRNSFYPIFSSSLQIDGNIVGIPLKYDGLGLFVDEDFFNTESKSLPQTWDELRTLAADSLKLDGDRRIERAGVPIGITQNVDHWQEILSLMMTQNGADLANPVGDLASNALSYFTVFAKEDGVWDDTLPSSTETFVMGRVPLYFGTSRRIADFKRMNPNLNFRVVPVPQLPKATPTQPNINWASYWAEGVATTSKNKTEAWKFLRFLSTQESLVKMSETAQKNNGIGFVYSRPNMNSTLLEDKYLGGFVQGADSARTWYMASFTSDGMTGINTRLSEQYSQAINKILNGSTAEDILVDLASGVKQVLSSYNSSTKK